MANITVLEALRSSLTATKKYVDDRLAEVNASGGYVHPDNHPASMITGLATVATSGDYNSLNNKPTIPTVTNDLTNELKANYDAAYTHSTSTHAPSNAQANADITKAEIEAKLTGDITSHTHSQYLTSVPAEYITETELNAKGYAPIDNPNFTNSISMGRKAGTTVGKNSVALGFDATASGVASHSEGMTTTASGECSHAEGGYTTASGGTSHSEGMTTIASGDGSHAEGGGTTALGTYSHAEGESTNISSNVIQNFSSSTSNDTIITAWNSNKFSLAKGESSHVEGKDNLALGNYSHAEGASTTASGTSSHAEGTGTTASGYASHAEGCDTKASSDYQHVQGQYNIEDTENRYLHIVGNGSSDTARSNAHTLDWNGNAWYKGKLSQDGIPTEDKDLTTKKYVDDYTGGKKLRYITKAQYEELTDEQKKDTSTIYNIIDDNIETINVVANADVTLKNTINDQVANIIWGESTGENIDNIFVESEYYPIPYKLTNNKSVWTMYKPDDSLLSKETCYFIAYKVKCNTLTMYPDYGSNGPVLASYDAAVKNTHDATGAWIYYTMRFPASYSSYGYKGIYPTSVYETSQVINAYAINVETEYATKSGTEAEFLNSMISKYGGLDLVPGQDYNSTSVLTSYSVDGSVLDTATQGTDDIINIVGGGKLSISSNSASVSIAIDTDHEHTNKDVLDTITIDKINSWDSKTSFDGNYESLTNKPESLPANGGNADTIGGYSIWVGIQQDYDTIPIKSDTTIYFIKEG